VDNQTKNKVRKFLTSVIAGDLSVLKNERSGICFNLNEYISPSIHCGYKIVQVHSHSWKHFNGDSVNPVTAIGNCKKWKNTQLKFRKSLCKHILENLENITI
jgi:hypothetical protein